MKDPLRRDTLLTAVGFSLIAAFFLFGLYLPGRRAAAELRAEIARLEDSMKDVPDRIEELRRLRRDIRRREDYLRSTERLVPDNPGVDRVLAQVSRLARSARLNVSRLEPLEVVDRATYRALPFRIRCQGEFSGVMRLLSGLERQDRLFAVDELLIEPLENVPGRSIEAEIDFAVYARRGGGADSAENDANPDP